MILWARRLLPWARLAAPFAVKRVKDRKRSAGFVQRWEVASWQKSSPGYEFRTVWTGRSAIRCGLEVRKIRRASAAGNVRVTFRGNR